jgi:hypothetical protein
MQNHTADKEILEYITTIADTYGMQVKQQTYAIDYVITNGNAGRMGGCPIIPLRHPKRDGSDDTDENFHGEL